VHDGKGGLQRLTSALAPAAGKKAIAKATTNFMRLNIVWANKSRSEDYFDEIGKREV
jgi:hypothetical protein